MKKNSHQWIVVVWILVFIMVLGLGSAFCKDDMVRAKIGILISSSNKDHMAKSRDRLISGDLLRLFVHPENASYIYVVYSDTQKAALLTRVEQGDTLVLPSIDESYEIDGASKFELFTIVVSPTELPEITTLLEKDAAHGKWAFLEKELMEKSRVHLTEETDSTIAIAGNVRGAGGGRRETNQSFVKKLRTYSGNAFLVKTFEFRVKK